MTRIRACYCILAPKKRHLLRRLHKREIHSFLYKASTPEMTYKRCLFIFMLMDFELQPSTRGILKLPFTLYGISYLGAPLQYISSISKCKMLVIACIHGEESETTFLLSRVLRGFKNQLQNTAFILCANPDGVLLGTRGNLHGVDLNRNFPAKNWSPSLVETRSSITGPRDTFLSPGNSPASEIETQKLVQLIEYLKPEIILSLHAPLACVDAPDETPFVKNLQTSFNLPFLKDIGYPTPGSLGSWCKEQEIECITLELPREHSEVLFEKYGKSFAEFILNF